MTYAASTNYVLSYFSALGLNQGVEEFETYSEAFSRYQHYQVSGYGVVIHELGFYR